jgi:hypothetical protein
MGGPGHFTINDTRHRWRLDFGTHIGGFNDSRRLNGCIWYMIGRRLIGGEGMAMWMKRMFILMIWHPIKDTSKAAISSWQWLGT